MNQNIDGYILAGGLSSRMGSPKAEVILGGKTLLQRAVETISLFTQQPATVVLHARSKIGVSGDVRIVEDVGPSETWAPIYGLQTALLDSTAEWIAILAVDLPFVTSEFFLALAEGCSTAADALVPVQPDGRPQPLCALYYRQPVLTAVQNAVSGSDLSLRGMLSQCITSYVDSVSILGQERSEHFFLNVNDTNDLSEASRVLKQLEQYNTA